MNAIDIKCDGCNAESGETCRQWCIGRDMLTIRELQAQLLDDYGILSEWIESGGGQKCLLVKIGDSSEHGEWLEIGSLEFNFVNEYAIPVSTFSSTLVVNGDTDMYSESIKAHDMARTIAREIIVRSRG